MQECPSVAALRTTLTALAANPASAHHESVLQEQVCNVVDEMHALGWPPERVIIAMKEIAADAGLYPSRRVMSVRASLDSKDALLGRLVLWCIERYFERAIPH